MKFHIRIKKHLLTFLAALSLIVPLGVSVLVFFRATIIPILFRWASRYVSPDGQVEPKTVQHFVDVISINATLLVVLSLLPPLFLIVGEFLSRRLPERRPDVESDVEDSVERKDWILLLLVLLIATIFRIHPMFQGFNDDEIFAAVHFIKVPSLIQTLTTFKAFHNHIGYSVTARVFYKLFGDTEWAFRLPSMLLGIATIYQVWLLGRKYINRNVAIAGALILAVLPFHVFYSSRARGYAAMTFLMLLGTRYFLELLHKKDISKSVMFVLTSVAGIYFQLCGAFSLLTQLIFTVIAAVIQLRSKNEKQWIDRECFLNLWICFSAIFLLSFLLYCPVLLHLIGIVESHGRQSFSPSFPIYAIRRFFGSFVLGITNVLLLVVGFVFLFRRHKIFALYTLCMITIPFLSLWLISPADLVARFLFFLTPYLCLISACGLFFLFSLLAQRKGIRFLRFAILAAGMLMVCFQAKLSWEGTPQLGFREVAYLLNEDVSAQTVLCATGNGAEFFQYYSPRPIRLLETKKDFDELLPMYKEVRCVYIFTPWISSDHELIRFLAYNSRPRRFHRTVIFIYRKPDQLTEISPAISGWFPNSAFLIPPPY